MNTMPQHRIERASGRTTKFVRTLLGDLAADPSLGVCDAHEHVIMHGDWLAANFPEFLLDDADRVAVDLARFRAAGGGWIVDSMPTGAGRDAGLLAEVSRRCGVSIVCPTGVHQERYYRPDHPLLALGRDELAELFVREVSIGVDDGAGALDLLAGVTKVASSGKQLTAQEIERFAAAAIAQRETGCPILTHTQGGPEAFEQVSLLAKQGASLAHVVLSHCDKNPDAAYHRDLLQTGIILEYDQHFRQIWRGERCNALDMIVALGDEFPNQIVVGMDMARQRYWHGYGGEPGMSWLVTGLLPLLRDAGVAEELAHRITIENALAAFAFQANC